MRRRNFGAKKVIVDGILFPSKLQAFHYQQLKLRVAANEITDLKHEVTFPIIVEGIKVCTYRADFTYIEAGRPTIYESKGFETAVFRLKWKLMKAVYPEYSYVLSKA